MKNNLLMKVVVLLLLSLAIFSFYLFCCFNGSGNKIYCSWSFRDCIIAEIECKLWSLVVPVDGRELATICLIKLKANEVEDSGEKSNRIKLSVSCNPLEVLLARMTRKKDFKQRTCNG